MQVFDPVLRISLLLTCIFILHACGAVEAYKETAKELQALEVDAEDFKRKEPLEVSLRTPDGRPQKIKFASRFDLFFEGSEQSFEMTFENKTKDPLRLVGVEVPEGLKLLSQNALISLEPGERRSLIFRVEEAALATGLVLIETDVNSFSDFVFILQYRPEDFNFRKHFGE